MIIFQFLGVFFSVVVVGIIFFAIGLVIKRDTDQDDVGFLLYLTLLVIVALLLSAFLIDPTEFGYMRII